MKIDPQIPPAENSSTNRVTDSKSAPPKNLPLASAPESSDTVQLSSGQATVRTLVSQINQVPDVRQDRVDSLRAEVQSGNFQRSNTQVAGAIVNQLLGSNPGS